MEGSGQRTGREQGELFIPSVLQRDEHDLRPAGPVPLVVRTETPRLTKLACSFSFPLQ